MVDLPFSCAISRVARFLRIMDARVGLPATMKVNAVIRIEGRPSFIIDVRGNRSSVRLCGRAVVVVVGKAGRGQTESSRVLALHTYKVGYTPQTSVTGNFVICSLDSGYPKA